MNISQPRSTSQEAQRIQDKLTAKRLKWPDLGAHLNASDQNLYNWRKRGVPKHRIGPVAKYLGCSIDWLLTGSDTGIETVNNKALLVPISHTRTMKGVNPKTASDEAIRIQDILDDVDRSWLDLGTAMNASDQNLYYWRNQGIPKPYLVPVASLLGCSIAWLLTGKTDRADKAGRNAIVTTPAAQLRIPTSVISQLSSIPAHLLVQHSRNPATRQLSGQ